MFKIFAISVLFFTHAAIAEKAAPLSATYTADLIAPSVYVIHGPTEQPNPANQGFMNNPSFIIRDEGVIVIDPGASVQTGDMLMMHIEKLTDKPVVAIFNTHEHGDHWLGNQALTAKYPAVKIYGHSKMAKQVEEGEGANWLDVMLTLTEGATAGTKVVSVTDTVEGGDVVKVAGIDFQILHSGPAHTTTDIMIYAKQLGVIYLGDNAGYGRVMRMAGGSFRGNITSLNNAIASGAKTFVPGHGKTAGAIAASSYRDYLEIVYDTAQKGFEDGKSDFEIRPTLLPKLDRWKAWPGFEHEVGPHISAAFLEAEAADFE